MATIVCSCCGGLLRASKSSFLSIFIFVPDERLRQAHPGSSVVDKNGNGDCAFQAIAHSSASLQNKVKIADEKIAAEAAKLRLVPMAISHPEKHSDVYERFWFHGPLKIEEQMTPRQSGQAPRVLLFLRGRANTIWLHSLLAAKIKNGVAKIIDVASKGLVLLF